jgi:hypothetical protein
VRGRCSLSRARRDTAGALSPGHTSSERLCAAKKMCETSLTIPYSWGPPTLGRDQAKISRRGKQPPPAIANEHETPIYRPFAPYRHHPPSPRPPLQAGGHRFDPGWLHSDICLLVLRYRESRAVGSLQSVVNTSTSVSSPMARMLASNVTKRTPRRRASVSRCASVTCR